MGRARACVGCAFAMVAIQACTSRQSGSVPGGAAETARLELKAEPVLVDSDLGGWDCVSPDPDAQRTRCEGGTGEACAALAKAYEHGGCRGLLPKDLAKAAALYEKACIAGAVSNCEKASEMVYSAEGVAKDATKATQLLERGCAAGLGNQCLLAGIAHGLGEGIPQDVGKAAQLYGAACEHGSGLGCATLGRAHQNGEGVIKDDARAADLFQKGCDRDAADGCFSLALGYEAGIGVRQSGAAAVDSYHRAGMLYLKAKRRVEALTCVERIRSLPKSTVPNAFLADELLTEMYGRAE
jgi:TPR repeat protein